MTRGLAPARGVAPAGGLMPWRTKMQVAALALIALGVQACATINDPDDPAAIARYEVNDPFEEWNRSLFALNLLADEVAVKPVAIGYTKIFPKPARRGITNFMNNVTSPITFANDLMQFEFTRAIVTLDRFVLNSIFGLAGFLDVATASGLPGHKEDFGQTLAVYGFGEGFYIMAPFIGPAPPRDLFGRVVDSAITPLNYVMDDDVWMLRMGLGAFDMINDRAENIETLENLERTSLDYYATVRSMYRQNRKSEIQNGRDFSNMPDFDLEDDFDLDDGDFSDDDWGEEEDIFNLGEDENLMSSSPGYDMFELGDDEMMYE